MIKAGQLSKGMFLKVKENPYIIVEREFVNPGKGSAFVRLKLKNLYNGSTIRETVKSQESVEEINVEYKNAQFLYMDKENYHFMDNETYEQFGVPTEGLENHKYYLKEGDLYQLIVWEEKPIDIKLPMKMVFVVAEAEHAERGDTVTGATKNVRTETGLQVKVPIFIKQGERILVNTDSGEYVERVN